MLTWPISPVQSRGTGPFQSPGKGNLGLKPKQRQTRVLDIIEREGEVTVDALAADFAVSAETVRRDLAVLAEEGLVQKVHGGARRLRLHAEGTFDERMD